jgi:hypothetical protein
VVRAERADAELAQLVGGGARSHTGEGLRLVLERQQGDDRQARHGANSIDGDHELVEVEECLEHEQIGASPFQDRRLLGKELGALLGVRVVDVAERADRPSDEDVAPGHLAGLPSESDACGVDPLEIVLEVVTGELATVRTERVRLDQLRAGADEADVERDHGVGGAQVRFLGRAEARHGAHDEGAHATVADDRRTGLEALDESVRCGH